jgi:nitroreductase
MDSKYKFKELMKERHSIRKFQKKEIPENILKEIISISLLSPSWANTQPWNIYVASGNTLEEIRKIWISKNKENIKGYSDIPAGHRTDFSERSQKIMENLLNQVGEFLKDPTMKEFSEANATMFSAPTVVYLTLPKGHTKYSILDLGALEMSIMLAAKDYGVDSIVAYELIKYPDVLRNSCKIPENEDIIIGIALGYEENDILNKFRANKLSLDEVCHFYK